MEEEGKHDKLEEEGEHDYLEEQGRHDDLEGELAELEEGELDEEGEHDEGEEGELDELEMTTMIVLVMKIVMLITMHQAITKMMLMTLMTMTMLLTMKNNVSQRTIFYSSRFRLPTTRSTRNIEMPGLTADDRALPSVPRIDVVGDSSSSTGNSNEATRTDRPFRRVFFRGPGSENQEADVSNQQLALRPYLSSPSRDRVRMLD